MRGVFVILLCIYLYIPSIKGYINLMYDLFDVFDGINGSLVPVTSKSPVFVSCATYSLRLTRLWSMIHSILDGSVIPDRIFVFVSGEPFLLDEGVSKERLRAFLRDSLQGEAQRSVFDFNAIRRVTQFVYTDNIGPHRKLLPLLQHYRQSSDVRIVTADDDRYYPKHWLSTLLQYDEYAEGTAVVSARARRIGLCIPSVSSTSPRHLRERHDVPSLQLKSAELMPYSPSKWPVAPPNQREMLLLPTGQCGVLYRPQHFEGAYEILFDGALINATKSNDDLLFRLASMHARTYVVTACMAGLFRAQEEGKGLLQRAGLLTQSSSSSLSSSYSDYASRAHKYRIVLFRQNDISHCPSMGKTTIEAFKGGAKAPDNVEDKGRVLRENRALSLYRSFNKYDNTDMWDSALDHLRVHYAWDITQRVVAPHAVSDRGHCTVHRGGVSRLIRAGLEQFGLTGVCGVTDGCPALRTMAHLSDHNQSKHDRGLQTVGAQLITASPDSEDDVGFNEGASSWEKWLWDISAYFTLGPWPVHTTTGDEYNHSQRG